MQPPVHTAHDRFRVGKGQPTLAPQRPQYALLVDAAIVPIRWPVESSPGRTKVAWWRTEDGGEHARAAIDLLTRLAGGKQPEGAMAICMVTHLMTRISDGANELWVPLGSLANDEKCGLSPKLRQNIQDPGRKCRVRTIVEGQRYHMSVGGPTPYRLSADNGHEIRTNYVQRRTCAQPTEQYGAKSADRLHNPAPLKFTVPAPAPAPESPRPPARWQRVASPGVPLHVSAPNALDDRGDR